jgi:hypothetical protein
MFQAVACQHINKGLKDGLYLFNRLRHFQVVFEVLRLYKISVPIIESEVVRVISLVLALQLEVPIGRYEQSELMTI